MEVFNNNFLDMSNIDLIFWGVSTRCDVLMINLIAQHMGSSKLCEMLVNLDVSNP